MSGVDIYRFLRKFNNKFLLNTQMSSQKTSISTAQNNFSQISAGNSAESVVQNRLEPKPMQNIQMNTLQSIDRSIYAKDLMKIPKNLNEFIYMLQRGLNLAQFNRMYAHSVLLQKNSLSQMQAQILAQLQDLDTQSMQEFIKTQLKTQIQTAIKNLEIKPNSLINLAQVSELFQQNGKEALTKIIMAMTQASKSGITDLSQLKDMARLINASVAVASENDSAKTLKLLLLLYMPWFPLEEGTGFDLEIETSDEKDDSASILTVTITTVNFGLVIGTIILETQNSVHISIECSEKFPKDELLKRLETEEKQYSMNTVTDFRINKDVKTDVKNPSAHINTSKINQISPYLLFSAHSLIKHVIDIDKNF